MAIEVLMSLLRQVIIQPQCIMNIAAPLLIHINTFG
ncbi:defective proboscis extension [Culex quinquefasciatus]|uniref:Defective proboscis extension n=1 Tax=Culex quinquefasciatus TaxID=7176 RepID=B0VZ07_CULQU|nr:defective proboscis extension [Culex quinquefasciatus]|eukprot:XP_001841811.1 defective proboscis extension [Culex quinquefasciatus]